MATLTVKGRKVNVDDSFLQLPPEQQEATVNEIAQSMDDAPVQQEAAAAPSIVGDVAQSAVAGLTRGVTGLVGLPGDAASMMDKGIDWAAGKMGLEAKGERPRPLAPTSSEALGAVESVVGKTHEPQTTAGKYARSIGEFAPGIMFGGPRQAISNVLAPAVASEAAGQATEGTAAEPFARVGAAVAGGLAPGMLARGLQRAPKAPSIGELGAKTDAAYDAMRNSNVVLTPYKADLIHKDVWGTLSAKGFDPDMHKDVATALKSLEKVSAQPLALETLDMKRRLFSEAAKDKGQSRLVRKAIERIDDHIANLANTDVVVGNPQQASSAIKDGRTFAHRKFKAEEIANALKKAERRTASTGSGGNIDNAIRQNIRKILDNPKKSRGFTADELAMMENVVKTGKAQNLARLIGKLSPQGSGLMAALGIGATAANPMLAAVPAAGFLAKAGADAATRSKVGGLSALIRSGGKATPPSGVAALDPKRLALIEALLGSRKARETAGAPVR
jgi:hypothetical protein